MLFAKVAGSSEHGYSVTESNVILNAALDSLGDHIALLSPGGVILGVNSAWADFASLNEYAGDAYGLGVNYLDICDHAAGIDDSDARAVAEGLRQVLSGERREFSLVYPCHSPSEDRWFRLGIRRVQGSPSVAAVATHSLVTQLHAAERRADDALRIAESDRIRLEATLAAIPVGAWIADADGQLTHSNPAAARIWGGSAPLASNDDGYAVYKGWWADTGVALADGEWALSQTIRTGETVADLLTEIERFDGTRGYLLSSAAPILDDEGRRAGAIAISVDVSEREEAAHERDALLKSLESERTRLAAIFEQASSFITVFRGPDFIIERANPAYLQLIGNRPVMGMPVAKALPEVTEQGFLEILQRVVATGEPYIGHRVPVRLARVLGAPLETRYVNTTFRRVIDADGSYSVVEHGVDVTDEVLVTVALRESEARLRDQFAKLPGPTLLWEERGDDFALIAANEAACLTFPWINAEALGQTARELTPGLDMLDNDQRRALRENTVATRSLELDIGDPLGLRFFDVTVGPQPPNRVLVHWVDTTARIALEAQLRQSQKLEAVGQLAGGIAHDFNNLLTVIIAYAGMLLAELAPDDESRLAVVEIEHAGRRAADLTRQLLTFSRKDLVSTQLVDVNAALRDIERLIPRLVGSDVALVVSLGEGPFPVTAGSGQIGQMLMNVVVNANHAMADGGTLRIDTARVELDDSFVQRHPDAHVGPHVRLRVQDTGHGMNEDTRARVFEPFFTTKGPGAGTGLGLSVVYGIVKQWNGSIDIESAVGEGTTISIFLPVAETTAKQLSALAVKPRDGRGAPWVEHEQPDAATVGTRILLVDDDDAVRAVVRRILTSSGYDVLEAASGIDALRLLDDDDRAVDVVLSDMVMPGMGGRDLAYEVRIRYPGAMLILMSGYTQQILAPDDPLRIDTQFLQKPFTPAVALAAVRTALASRQARGHPNDALGVMRIGVSNDRQALDALVNGIDAIVWESDARTGRYHYVSRRAQSLLGFPREDWHREGFWSSIVHPDDRERVIALRRNAHPAQECTSNDYRLVSADGTVVWIRDVVCVVSRDSDARVRLGGVMFDVTVAKNAMAELVLAKESAEQSDTAKSEFLKLVSHALHTPLNSIIGFANILRKNRNQSLTDNDLTYVERIAANGQQLLTIVRDVLDVTKMEAGTLELLIGPVQVGVLVEEMVRAMEGAARVKGLVLSAAVPEGLNAVMADHGRLRQVLANLIGNGIKYTDAGSVTVCVMTAADGVTATSIEITDTGVGIAADRLETIFSVFHQEESFTDRRRDGTGMGLGIARGLCKRMGFGVAIASELGRGTRVVIRLRHV